MKRTHSYIQKIVKATINLSANLQQFKINDDLTVTAESLELDMPVMDASGEPFANQEFTFEDKVYKTGENGEILSIEDVVADAETEEVQAADEAVVEPAQDNANAELDTAKKRIEELEVENQALKAELATIKDEAVQLASQIPTQGINLSDVSTDEVEKPKSTLGVIRAALNK